MNGKIRDTKTGRALSIRDGYLFDNGIECAKVGTPLFEEILADREVKAVRVTSLEFAYYQNVWIDGETILRENISPQFTMRKERKGMTDFWYAYRRYAGTLHKRYVGRAFEITNAKLVELARKLPGSSL